MGSIVGMGLISAGNAVFPTGIDPNDMEALGRFLSNAPPKYFLFPFLAHAIGTGVGAFVAVKIGVSHHMKLAFALGGVFLLGGILVSTVIPAPTWFVVLDLVVAYIPMAYVGWKWAIR